jgi:ferric-dicitrate binding protein FerR (iron transport regulator)
MDFVEKAVIRLNHWLSHNQSHEEEYERFAKQLDELGKAESAVQIREMIRLSKQSRTCLQRALKSLEAQ